MLHAAEHATDRHRTAIVQRVDVQERACELARLQWSDILPEHAAIGAAATLQNKILDVAITQQAGQAQHVARNAQADVAVERKRDTPRGRRGRSEESCVGKEGVRSCQYWRTPY